VTVLWAVLLLVLAYVSVSRDVPTVREQRSFAQAAPVVHRVVGELVAAAGAGTVVEIRPAEVTGCRVTAIRDGVLLDRDVVVYSAAGGGPALIDRMATALPTAYGARALHGKDGTVHRLLADAGEFVGIRGGLGDGDVLTLTVSTGCRPRDGVESDAQLLPGENAVTPEQARVLAALGLPAVEAVDSAETAPCPGGDRARTRLVTAGPAPADLTDRLTSVTQGATVLMARPDRYVWRSGATGLVVESVDGQVRVSASTGCPGS
jgi:hypothetical protein